MSIIEREGRFGVRVYDPAIQRKRWVGTFATRAEAEEAQRTHSEHFRRAPGMGVWTLESKGESACRNCGASAEHLHHVVPIDDYPPDWRSGNDPRFNGMALCRACHLGWHANAVEINADVLRPEELAFVLGSVGRDWLEMHYPGAVITPFDAGLAGEVADLRAEVARLRGLLHQIVDGAA